MPLAIIAFIALMLVPIDGLNYQAQAAIALMVFAIIMWVTEALHLAITSLIILFIQPLIGVASFNDAVIGFANPIIFLMIGGFIMAEAIRKSGLTARATYALLKRFGTSPKRSLFVTVFSTGIFGAWIENIVAYVMLLPIIKEIIPLMGVKDPEKGKSNFAKSMVLGGSYASMAGGFATEIGTAPNLMVAAYTQIPFVDWMIFGFPIAFAVMFIIWQVLGKVFKPEVSGIVGGKKTLSSKIESLGPITRTEKITAVIFLFTIGLWVTGSITGINSYSVALIGAVLFFAFKLIDWKDAQNGVDWGLILFFGGALSLGAALLQTGAANWIITNIINIMGSDPSPTFILIVLMIVTIIIAQVMSNIALAAILVPLSVTLALSQGQPIGMYAVPVAIGCSLSFMLPMADPTIALAYGTGYVKLKDMVKAGFVISVLGTIVTIIILYFARPLLG